MDLSQLLLRLFLSFFILFILTRIMGRKEISQLTFFNFVSAISIGAIAAELALNESLKIQHGIIALTTWTIFTLIMAFIDIKSKEARKITTGEPTIVIENGKLVENALRKTQLDLDSLKALLRKKDIFDLKQVEYAIFETSGDLNVLKSNNHQTATRGDLNIDAKPNQFIDPLSTELVSDGKVNKTNLTKLNLTVEWLNEQLKKHGIDQISDVLYAELSPDGTLFVNTKQNH